MPLPNFVIAGPPKAGTTSVFRYLAGHPDVAPSSIKEVHFFQNYLENIDKRTLQQYDEYFKAARSESIRMEASPRYMQGGARIADALSEHLPDAKICLILREPVDRFLSRYISLITKTERIAEEHQDLDALIAAATADPQASVDVNVTQPEQEIVEYLWQGAYAPYIAEYLARYPKKQIGLFYFDELKNDPKGFMVRLCAFLDIDAGYFDNFAFSIENKTRTVRFPAAHKMAERMNRFLEPLQNKMPGLRRSIKTLYYAALNPETDSKSQIDTQQAEKRLEAYYANYNAHLREILKDYAPDEALPDWLTEP